MVSDAHLGVAPAAVEEVLLEFLHACPTLGDCLLINGDLFDFWFTYSRVIPRRGFHVAAALASLRGRMPIVMVGGTTIDGITSSGSVTWASSSSRGARGLRSETAQSWRYTATD